MDRDLNAVRIHLNGLELSAGAQAWLLELWESIQAIDDIKDNGPKPDAEALAWRVFYSMPSNVWFQQHSGFLLPLLSNAVIKWVASNTIEESGDMSQLHKSYMWRAAYWDIVLQAAMIDLGPDEAMRVAPKIAAMYGDNFEKYVDEVRGQ